MDASSMPQARNYYNELAERASAKFPDRKFAPDGDDLNQAIVEMIEESDNLLAEQKSKNDEMVKLLVNDTRSASFLQEWARTGDPRAALVRIFGDDLESLSTEEGRNQFAEDLKSWRDTKAQNDALAQEAEQNWQKSLEALDAFGNEHGLSDEEKVKIILRLVNVAASALVNEYHVEDFEMVLKETNYDSAVESARKEGEIAGRNSKIEARKLSQVSESASMPPTVRGGQGARVPENRQQQRHRTIWDSLNE